MAKHSEADSERFRERERRDKEHRGQLPGGEDEPLPPPVEPIQRAEAKPKRNDPCPCSSGKKYKQCCGKGA